jgi:glutamate formiminotransferase / formiminotetrahydrofolate cyclodeaminase
MLDAGKYFLKKQERSVGLSEAEIIKIAVKSLGLDELGTFDPKKKIIEYQLEATHARPLLQMNLRGFADETASESMAPGGGSISAYVGALGASLATMVANLSSHKPGWDEQWEVFSKHAAEGQLIKDTLLKMVDEDTHAFNAIIAAFRLPKGTTAEKAIRKEAVQAATRYAIEVPFQVMEWSLRAFELALAMVKVGNPNSISDAGVGGLCARAAIYGAYMNVKINAGSLEDKKYVAKVIKDGKKIVDKADKLEKEVLRLVEAKVGQ